MKNRPKHSHLPFLVTLAGCVLMLAWVDSVKANEVSRQLTSKGFVISQLRKSEVEQVKASRQNFKLILKGFQVTEQEQETYRDHQFGVLHSDYHFIFPHYIKSSLKEELSSWLRRE